MKVSSIFSKYFDMASFRKELKQNQLLYLALFLILLISFFVRTYRLSDLLGFYYDQGRDALVIWRLFHEGKFFLIGPVTGLAGIFLGPFYYYLIAPFYFLGGGNPVAPASFLAFLSTFALLVLYYLGWKMHSRATGLMAVIIGGFSYYLVLAGRWLSNPTPILLTSILLFGVLWEILKGKDEKLWIVASFLIGISLHFESASAVFYLPILLACYLWVAFSKDKKSISKPSVKTIFISSGVFLATLLPQILFNFRHENLLLNNFLALFTDNESFSLDYQRVLSDRLIYFEEVYLSKIYPAPIYSKFFATVSLIGLILAFPNLWKKKVIQIFTIFFGIPAIGYILFQGNYGNIYDYYLTGYYMPMILFFAIGLGSLWEHEAGKIFVLSFFAMFLSYHGLLLKNYLSAGVDGPTHITMGNQKQAVEWVLADVENNSYKEFQVDVYVPPVIPYAYNYLFNWMGDRKCGSNFCGKIQESENFYLLYEVDPPHPERLEAWLTDRAYAKIVNKVQFGGVYVEKRVKTYE